MSTTPVASAEAKPNPQAVAAAQPGIDRRRRKRAKITAQVHVRGVNCPEPFEEVCKSIDVSRFGLLFTAARAGYWKGQRLEIIFPYSSAAAHLNSAQHAEIVRVTEHNGQYAVAVQFVNAKDFAAVNPRAVDPSLAGAPDSSTATLVKAQSVVLAVEADPKTADIMRNVLSNDGYTVIIVPTAQQALEVLKTTVPAVFLAEVEGTDMSGHDLCLIIKRNDRLQRVPVILLTKSAQPADYSASHQLGAVVCMAKPFKPERLLHVVRLVSPPPSLKSAYGSARANHGTVERNL